MDAQQVLITPARTAAEVAVVAIDDPRWADLVATSPDAMPFHHPAWARLIAECYGLRAFALVVRDADEVLGGVPVIEAGRGRGRRWISLPFTDHCPPLVADALAPAQLVEALDGARRAAGVGRVELREELSDTAARTWSPGVLHTLALDPDPDVVHRGFKKTAVKQRIRQAERKGLTARRGTTLADMLDVFYPLQLDTRRRLGVPVQPRRFFELLWRRIVEPGLGRLVIVERGEEPVGAGVFLSWNGTTVYKYGASDHRHWDLHPNHVMLWSAIQAACLEGCHSFDFGRSEPENAGLRTFKSAWGATERPLTYSVLGGAPPSGTPGAGRLGAVGGAVIRRSPRWVCAAAGRVLYKHTA